MPATNEEIETNKRNFFRVAGMPCVIGAIDGTLIKFQEVGGANNKTMLFCRKQFYAINTQIVCNASAMILDIVARWPGAIHDETVLLNSRIYEQFYMANLYEITALLFYWEMVATERKHSSQHH